MIRAFFAGMRVQLKQLATSSFDIVAMLVWPIVYASIAFYLLDARDNPRLLLSAAVGTAVMLIWSQVVVGSSYALDYQRTLGTLELIVAAPIPLAVVLAPIMITSALFGLYGLVATLVWGRLAFGIPITVVHPLALVAAIPACVVAIGLLGLITASTFVVYRAAVFLGIAMQYPVWIASGLLVPLSVLPGWLGPVSWLLAPTWGFRAIERAMVGGNPWPAIGMCAVVSAAYLGIAIVCLRVFERLARQRATLRLA